MDAFELLFIACLFLPFWQMSSVDTSDYPIRAEGLKTYFGNIAAVLKEKVGYRLKTNRHIVLIISLHRIILLYIALTIYFYFHRISVTAPGKWFEKNSCTPLNSF
jgi:hypothetical protein